MTLERPNGFVGSPGIRRVTMGTFPERSHVVSRRPKDVAAWDFAVGKYGILSERTGGVERPVAVVVCILVRALNRPDSLVVASAGGGGSAGGSLISKIVVLSSELTSESALTTRPFAMAIR